MHSPNKIIINNRTTIGKEWPHFLLSIWYLLTTRGKSLPVTHMEKETKIREREVIIMVVLKGEGVQEVGESSKTAKQHKSCFTPHVRILSSLLLGSLYASPLRMRRRNVYDKHHKFWRLGESDSPRPAGFSHFRLWLPVMTTSGFWVPVFFRFLNLLVLLPDSMSVSNFGFIKFIKFIKMFFLGNCNHLILSLSWYF